MNKKNVVATLAWGCLMIPSLLLASGCITLGCTQAGCENGASISISGLEANQLYDVELVTEDDTVLCTIDTSDEMLITCDKALFYFSQLNDAHIEIGGTPDRVAITVRQNGNVIAEDEARPDYDEVAPNGEACGPVCQHAEVPFVL